MKILTSAILLSFLILQTIAGNTCPPGYYGDRCSFPICFGVPSNSQKACTGRGICVRPDVCLCFYPDSDENCRPVCPPNFAGPRCSFPVCFGIPSFDAKVCSGRGVCNSPNKCTCKPGWTGPQCETPTSPPTDYCFGLIATDPNACSGHGNCVGTDKCTCNNGWAGSKCESPVCYGLAAYDPNVCSAAGTCSAPDTCNCQAGHTGNRCENTETAGDILCFGLSAGDANVCSGHGTCVGADQCQCNAGWSGPQCNVAQCPAGYTGANCDIPICFSQPANDANVCFGHGRCVGPDQCSCQPGWIGDRCNVADVNTGKKCSETQCPAGEICCDDALVGALCYKAGEHTCTNIGNDRYRYCCCPTCLPCGDDLRCYNTRFHQCVNGQVLPLPGVSQN